MRTDQPIISASLLSEYCYATPPRRARILEQIASDQFEPFKNWYGELPGAYRRHLATGTADPEPLAALERVLIRREARTSEEENKILKQLDAIEHIRQIDHERLFAGTTVSAFDHLPRTFSIAGTVVRVNPTNLIVASRLGFKETFIGVVKPYFKATRALPDDEAKTFCAILHWFVDRELSKIGVADFGLMWVADVFKEQLHRAPRSFLRRRELIEASAAEISDRWLAFVSRRSTKAGVTASGA